MNGYKWCKSECGIIAQGIYWKRLLRKKKIPKVIVTRLETLMDDGQSVDGEWVNSLLAG